MLSVTGWTGGVEVVEADSEDPTVGGTREAPLSLFLKAFKGYSSSESESTATKSESHLGFKCYKLRLCNLVPTLLAPKGTSGGVETFLDVV